MRYGREALALAQAIGDRRRQVFATSFIVPALIALGEWGEGLRMLEEVLPLLHEYARVHLPFVLMYLGTVAFEIGDLDRARSLLGEAAAVQTIPNPGWRQASLVAQVYLARLSGDGAALNRALDDLLRLPWGKFIPDDGEVLLPVGEGLLAAGRAEEARQLAAARRPDVERWSAPAQLGMLEILEARLAAHDGNLPQAARRLEQAIQRGMACENVLVEIRARELQVQLFAEPPAQEALRALLGRVIATLPEDRRAAFPSSPRAAALRAAP